MGDGPSKRSAADGDGEETVALSAELAAASASFTLKLPSFEGPLDLLLHLIREHKLDIFDIPIAFITDEYVGHLSRMKELNLDVAGEFLVMAATLAHIKSRMLLPRPETPEEGPEEEEGDPRADLVRRLLEHQKYKAAADDLARQDLLGRDVFTRSVKVPAVALGEGEVGLKEVSVIELVAALDRVLKALAPEKQHEVRLDRTSIGHEIHRIVERLKASGVISFTSLFEGMTARHQVIAAFLGLLELARLKLIRVGQEEPGGEILLHATDRLGDGTLDVKDDFR